MESNVARSGSGWIITSTGRFGDVVLNRFEAKYDNGWQAVEHVLRGHAGGSGRGRSRPRSA